MSFDPNNVLITGGAGFIGANFVRHWLGTTHAGKVVVLHALTYAGNIENLAGVDRAPLERFHIGTIVHFAEESHVDRSILGPDDFIRTNIVGTHALLKAAQTP